MFRKRSRTTEQFILNEESMANVCYSKQHKERVSLECYTEDSAVSEHEDEEITSQSFQFSQQSQRQGPDPGLPGTWVPGNPWSTHHFLLKTRPAGFEWA